MKKSYIVAGIIGIVLIAASIYGLKNGDLTPSTTTEPFTGVAGDPIDIATDFYQSWTDAITATNTDPYAAGLLDTESLSPTVRQKLADAESAFRTDGTDPVVCQTTVPTKMRAKKIYDTAEKFGIMIYDKDSANNPGQTVITLESNGELWRIADIECAQGETAPDTGEFSFDQTGYLLKDSVQPPLDPQYWHLVFEQNGTSGYTAPLFLDATSVCHVGDSDEPCAEAPLNEALHVHVQGTMTESGVEVARIERVE